MTRPPEDWDPSEDELEEPDEDEGQAYDEDEQEPSAPGSRTPMIMGIIGIICWFMCGPGPLISIVLGALGQRKARELEQSETVPRVAWIGGAVACVLDLIGAYVALTR